MAITYDRSVIQEFADKLYARARAIVVVFTLVGFFVGLVAGGALSNSALRVLGPAGVVVVAVVGALIGLVIGQSRAFMLKLQAQTALCQAQIEENTRAPAGDERYRALVDKIRG